MRLLALVFALAATTTLAQERPCKADRQKFCGNQARGPATRECMKAHAAELSDTCKQAVAMHRQNKKGAQQPAPVAP